MTEETLSDKIFYLPTDAETSTEGAILSEDIKEAVKKLKEELTRLNKKYKVIPMNYVFDGIDEIFGEELSK